MTNKERLILQYNCELIDKGYKPEKTIDSVNSDEIVFIYSHINENNHKTIFFEKNVFLEDDRLSFKDLESMILF